MTMATPSGTRTIMPSLPYPLECISQKLRAAGCLSPGCQIAAAAPDGNSPLAGLDVNLAPGAVAHWISRGVADDVPPPEILDDPRVLGAKCQDVFRKERDPA